LARPKKHRPCPLRYAEVFLVMSLIYEPKADWIKKSHTQKLINKTGSENYNELLKRSQEEPEWFWDLLMKEFDFTWTKPYSKILSQGLPWPKWAEGGELSVVENCIDRHLEMRGDQPALIFEADSPGQSETWTYKDLARESSYIAAELKNAGAQVGDRAALLMPMSLEMVAAFFGILRAGLTVIPIFSGYGAEAISSRINDGKVKFVFIQNKTSRRSKNVPVKENWEKLLPECPSVQKTFILDREEFHKGHKNQEIIPPISIPAEKECMLLYTSGTTGNPKACVHTSFGILATTGKELRYGFDLQEGNRFFWYTDIGWMMGPWELFGSLQFGSTVMLYEGVPDYPNCERLWQIIDEHKITHLGISPTAVRVLKKAGDSITEKYSLQSLRILGSTGEPWDEETYNWFYEKIGKKRCPIINISGGTEIMGCLLYPSVTSSLKTATLGAPGLGVKAEVWSEDGKKLDKGLGHLVCLSPLPSMTKGFLNSPERYLNTYFEKFGEKVWYHGDWALIDDDGFWYLRGRSDDTIKVAGKRVGPNEFESALMDDQRVAESAAVGIPHEIKGMTVYCYVVLKDKPTDKEEVRAELQQRLVKKMGKALAAEKIYFVAALPKTRSGKILRGLIQKIAQGEKVDESAAENPASLDAVRKAS
jgi:acetyl-CoA synthetase